MPKKKQDEDEKKVDKAEKAKPTDRMQRGRDPRSRPWERPKEK